jgi:hypothetical protein
MNPSHTRASENVLFTALLAAVIGWTAVSLAWNQPTPSAPAASLAAKSASHHA